MTRTTRTWYLERTAPVRADAEGLFLPASDLPEADVGDVVVVKGHDDATMRAGPIAATAPLDEEEFFRVVLHDGRQPDE
ncbi:MAG: hypothetical protein HZB15_14325 [Actinobacteria bacterium]|nr:hypothetical protein [Actinomycetota bacterium]